MITLKDYFELDPKKKDAQWGNNLVTYLRQYGQPLISQNHALLAMNTLFSDGDMTRIRGMFDDADNTQINFSPIPVLEKIRNIFITKIKEIGVNVSINATDPTSKEERNHDKDAIQNRNMNETLISFIHSKIGKPPYNMTRDKDKPFFGNLEEFENMGLDSNDPNDISFFLQNFHKLPQEINGEEILNYFVKYNRVYKLIEMWVNDIIKEKTLSAQAYTNDVTGAIDWQYLAPETCYVLGGKLNDFSDALAKYYQKTVSVTDLINILGNDFSFENDFGELLRAVNYANSYEYTGIHVDGYLWYGTDQRACSITQFLNFNVSLGYIEFQSIDANAYKGSTDLYGNSMLTSMDLTLASKWDPETDKYKVETEYNQNTYKANYLIISPTAQRLYKWGKLPYQQIEGYNDQRTRGTILMRREVGKSVTQIAIPFIELIQKSFYKVEWMAIRAKPPGTDYNYDSLEKIALILFPESNTRVGVEETMKLFSKYANRMHTTPEIDGKPTGGGGQVNYEIPGGLSASVKQFMELMDWCFNMINQLIGIAPIADVQTPQPRESLHLQMAALDYSEKATMYIPTMVHEIITQLCERTLYYTQDIIHYGKNTVNYRFLENAVGKDTLNGIKELDKVAFHRYGLFVESLSEKNDEQELQMMCQNAVQNKTLTIPQYLLIKQIKSPKKAFITLAYFEARNTKIQEQQALQAQQAASNGQIALEKEKQNTERIKAIAQLETARINGEYALAGRNINADAGLAKQKMKQQGDTEQIEQEAQNQMQQIRAEQQQANAAPPPQAAPPQPAQQQGQQMQEAQAVGGQPVLQ